MLIRTGLMVIWTFEPPVLNLARKFLSFEVEVLIYLSYVRIISATRHSVHSILKHFLTTKYINTFSWWNGTPCILLSTYSPFPYFSLPLRKRHRIKREGVRGEREKMHGVPNHTFYMIENNEGLRFLHISGNQGSFAYYIYC